MVVSGVAVVWSLLPSLRLLLIWIMIASLVAVVLKLFILKVMFLRSAIQKRVYRLQLLSKSQQNTFRTIRVLLDPVINISMPGILMVQVMIQNRVLNVLLHPFLTNLES